MLQFIFQGIFAHCDITYKYNMQVSTILLTLDILIEKDFLHPTRDRGIMFLNGSMVSIR